MPGNFLSPLSVAARACSTALKEPCHKSGWYASEEIARRELRHIQQCRRGPQSSYYPKRYYYCDIHEVWHLTSRD